jgi:isopenicillin N synthase-like dioxygenase
MDTIPVIDIAPFLNGDAKGQEAVAREVDNACSALGFLIISGHGVPDCLIDDMRTVSRAYFDLPLEEKLQLRMPPDRYRGYISAGSEALSYSLDQESPPDLKESFSIGPIDTPDDPYHRAAKPGKFFAPIAFLQRSHRTFRARSAGLTGDLAALRLVADFAAGRFSAAMLRRRASIKFTTFSAVGFTGAG